MNVLLINGSPHQNGCTNAALEEIARTLAEQDIDSTIAWIGRNPIRGCQACGSCGKTGSGQCIFDDDVVNGLIEQAATADGIIVGSPVYYSGANGALTCVLDRMFYAGSARLRHKPAAAIASARRAGTTATIMRLNQYFLFNNMPVVPSSYWTMVHGSAADEVARDEEGMHTMRTLARNMAWMLKCFEVGSDTGIGVPEIEPKRWTNFIR